MRILLYNNIFVSDERPAAAAAVGGGGKFFIGKKFMRNACKTTRVQLKRTDDRSYVIFCEYFYQGIMRTGPPRRAASAP